MGGEMLGFIAGLLVCFLILLLFIFFVVIFLLIFKGFLSATKGIISVCLSSLESQLAEIKEEEKTE